MVDEDRAFITFSSILNEIAAKNFKAGTSHEEAEQFVKLAFDKYKKSELPRPEIAWITSAPRLVRTWIMEELQNSFSRHGARPKWLHEPSWRFLDGVPMSFVKQFSVEEGEHDDYGGLEMYVFFGKRYISNDEWELVVKMIRQDEHDVGTIFI